MVHNISKIALFIAVSLVVGCGKDSSTQTPSPVPSGSTSTSTSTNTKKDVIELKSLKLTFHPAHQKYRWMPQYSQSILHYMDRAELQTLVDTRLNFYDLMKLNCNGYTQASIADKKLFWITFIGSIAHAESSLNTDLVYHDVDGTLSSGLLQIDLQSANRHTYVYTKKRFTQKDLHNPDLNLMAGLYVMKHQLEGGMNDDRPEIAGRLFTERSYYWSVLTLKRDLIIKTFKKNALENLNFCFIGQP